ncbi:XVIPCD domain-containing protein [Lysobacter enzymogenes]|uniref:XVIPCD domain-containing protein n=1 Tax=Lysobacter enzymogenes TaxID=69 RepID=UPI0038506963
MATIQDESEAGRKLDAMLSDFERSAKTDDLNPGEIFRGVLDSTPGLKAQFLLAVEKGHLIAIEAEPDPRFNGSYNHVDRTMRLSVGQLSTADPNQSPEDLRDGVNFIRFTAGHEINHALSCNESLQLGQRFREQVAAIANTPSPHDFTAPVKAYNEGARAVEARAEIAGFNTIASQVKQEKPKATLADVYDADGGASNYINESVGKPPRYTATSGLHIKPDLQMDADKSLEAMAKTFYDGNAGYPARNIDWAFAEIYRQEAIAQAAHPGRAFPEIRIDIEALGAKVTLPPDFKDTSRTPPDKSAPPVERSTAPGADDPGHPDHTLLEKIRSSVRDLERGMGKPWDDQSERMSASALTLAVARKFGPDDDVKVALNRATGQNARGEVLFVHREGRGASPDPAANYAQMPISQALSLPAAERYEQAQAMRETQAVQHAAQETTQQTQEMDGQSATGPRMQR